jgi:hypothetical protein
MDELSSEELTARLLNSCELPRPQPGQALRADETSSWLWPSRR